MFNRREAPKYQRMLEDELERRIRRLPVGLDSSEEYAKDLAIIERLHGLMPQQKASSVSRETWVNAGTNLLGIFMIISYERFNVLNSKALGFVARTRM